MLRFETKTDRLVGELTAPCGAVLLKMWATHLPERPVTPFFHHAHTRFEVTVINRGRGQYFTRKKVYPIEPGDVFVFSSGEEHYIRTIEPGGLDVMNLHFEPRFLGETFSESFGDSGRVFCYFHDPDFESRVPADSAGVIRMHHAAMQRELEDKEEQYDLVIRSHLHLLLTELLRHHGYRSAVLPHNDTLNLLAVYDYIDRHIEEKITLKELASVAGFTPNYFSHKFKELNGASLWDYITTRRVERALGLILSGERATMLEIALRCGFSNTVSFNKAFRKVKGCAPGAIRRDPGLLLH